MRKAGGTKREKSPDALLFRVPGADAADSLRDAMGSRLVRVPMRERSMPGTETLDEVAQGAADAVVGAELRGVLDSVPVGVLLIGPAGRIRFTNAKFAQLLGLGSGGLSQIETYEALARAVAGRFRDTKAFSYRWHTRCDGSGEPARDELELSAPARRVLERVARPVVDLEGRAVGWLETYQDITSQRHFQSKLLQTEKMAAIGQLVSGIAHELNNPLTAIMGYAQLLLGRGLSPRPLAEAEHIYQDAERARRIVKNLLFFARENKPERSQANLNEIVERTLALRGYELKIENIAVDCTLAPNLPPTLADPHQLQQVVLNLLVNAEQALIQGRGGGHVSIRTYQPSLQRVAVEIADDGPGVAPEIASRIFDPFFSTKPPGEGTGLGLSIAYGIVKQHGGDVYFENQPGGGARFVVDLPVVSVADAVPAAEILADAAQPTDVGASRILVVEDESTVANLIADVLKEEGHHVEVTLDSQDGLARLARGHFDAVLCDLRMPRLDGPAFYDALAQAGSPMKDRILFITGDTLAPRTRDFLEPRALPHLDKPFLVEELKLAVNAILERNRPSSAAASGAAGPAAQPETFEVAKKA
jgi:signal transduction histidine kinase/CheY-like chemotaxis protein